MLVQIPQSRGGTPRPRWTLGALAGGAPGGECVPVGRTAFSVSLLVTPATTYSPPAFFPMLCVQTSFLPQLLSWGAHPSPQPSRRRDPTSPWVPEALGP